LIGSCQHTDGFHSVGDSPASIAATVQRTARPADETGAVEEYTSPVNHAGVGTGVITEDATLGRLGMTLEAGRLQRGRQRGDQPVFVGIA
jgi:hypothetical protein